MARHSIMDGIPLPNAGAVLIADPRPGREGRKVGVVAFSAGAEAATRSESELSCDQLCSAAVLSNAWHLGEDGLQLAAPCNARLLHPFQNATAAFEALSYWHLASDFSALSASDALQEVNTIAQNEEPDQLHAGFGSAWHAMFAVLEAKFSQNRDMAEALLLTGDAFLLYHGAAKRSCANDLDGEGLNLLALQLMLLRDRLSANSAWTDHLKRLVDVDTGLACDQVVKDEWQQIVRAATLALASVLGGRHKRTKSGESRSLLDAASNRSTSLELAPDLGQRLHTSISKRRNTHERHGDLGIISEDVAFASAPPAPIEFLSEVVSEPPSRLSCDISESRDLSIANSQLGGSPDMSEFSSEGVSEVWEPGEEERYPAPKGFLDVNRPGIFPVLIFTSLWVAAAASTLFAILWVYAYEEAKRFAEAAAEAAATHAHAHLAEVLAPALALSKSVGAGFESGAITSLSDYAGILRLLTPHFAAESALLEVELAEPRGYLGAVHIAPSPTGGTTLLTDRDNCAELEGRRGCSLEPMYVNTSEWYKRLTSASVGQQFWEGPSFSRQRTDSLMCSDFCWHSAYALAEVIKIGDGANQTQTGAAALRAAVATSAIQSVAATAGRLARGDGWLCRAEGEVIAAADMADALRVDSSTGDVSQARIWEINKPWAAAAQGDFLERATPSFSFLDSGVRISAWPVPVPSTTSGAANPMPSDPEAAALRLVLAVRDSAFLDPVLGPFIEFGVLLSILPMACIVLLTLVSGGAKCFSWFRSWCGGSHSSQKGVL